MKPASDSAEHRTSDRIWGEPLANWLVRRRRLCLFLAFVIIVGCAAGFRLIVLENDYRTFIGDDNAALQVSDWLSDRQGLGREPVVLIYSAADRNVFSSQSLLQYAFIARAARKLPLVVDTESLLDIKKLVVRKEPSPGTNPDYREAPFTFGVDLFSDQGREILKRDALALPVVRSRFVGSDGASAAVLLFLELHDDKPRRDQLREFYAGFDGIAASVAAEVPGDRIHLAGATLFDYSAAMVLASDIKRIFPLALVLIAASFYAIYRSGIFVLTAMVIVFLPVAGTAGLSGLVGLKFSNLSISALLLVGTLAVAEVIHISNSFFKLLGEGTERSEAVRVAVRNNLKAISATTLATAIGETALLFSAALPIQITGLVIILGSAVSLVLILLLLPSLLMVSQPRNTRLLDSLSDYITGISMVGFRHPVKIIACVAVLLVVCIFGIQRAHLSDDLAGWFKRDTGYRQAMQLMNDGYLGGDTLTFAVEARNEDLVAARTGDFSIAPITIYREAKQALAAQSGEGKWLDPVGAAESAASLMNGAEPTSLKIDNADLFSLLKPFSTESAAASGLMTRFQPGKTDYSLWFFDSDRGSSFELVELANTLDGTLEAHAAGREVKTGGIGLALAQLSIDNFWNMLNGSMVTLVLICALMFAIQWSLRMGIVALLPNIAPLLIAFGIWGYWYGYYNLATITVFSVALGIVVDDTMHLLLKYQLKRRHAASPEQALRAAINECGVGVLITTIIVGGGFLLIGTSGFLLTAQKGLLAGIAVFAAFLFDIFVLPALIALASRPARVRAFASEQEVGA